VLVAAILFGMRTGVDVHNYLVERDVQHELFNVRGRLRSAKRIASVLDLPPSQVGKVVVFESDRGPLAALIPSDREVDAEGVRKAVRAKEVRGTTQARASQLSEYLGEAVPPAGLPGVFRVVIDRALAAQDVLYFAAGEASAVLKLRGKVLVRATGARVAPIAS
jgi:prolyl-tRNA editing enzyme YbaK/EbsC (Cys-tRNA(Pro) deacylase)